MKIIENLKKELKSGKEFGFCNIELDEMQIEFSQSLGGKEHFKICMNLKIIHMSLTFKSFENKLNSLIEKHNFELIGEL